MEGSSMGQVLHSSATGSASSNTK